MNLAKQRQSLQDDIRSQKEWIKYCGEFVEGYIARYAPSGTPAGVKNARAIYGADMARLTRLERELELLPTPRGNKRTYAPRITVTELEATVESVGVASAQVRGLLVAGGGLQRDEVTLRQELIRVHFNLLEAHRVLLTWAGRPPREPGPRKESSDDD